MLEVSLPLILYPLFFLVAFIYSTVGHGGASGYLAMFALLGIASPEIAPVALVLNIVVASTGWWQYWKGGYFSWNLLLPFVIASFPAAFAGGLIATSPQVFSALLGFCLLWAALRLAFFGKVKVKAKNQKENTAQNRKRWLVSLLLGAGLGMLSGLVGVGGGIFLSPLLLFLKWSDVKKTAATSSAFIVLNSLSGLSGHIARSNIDVLGVLPLALTVFVGGFLGSRTGAHRFNPRTLQILLALVLAIAGGKLFLQVLST
jgi:uncharacterized membrane protein YfcA